ncbi:MAG: reverse transcriptase domain-containing protein [Planctomycetota bacterium]
MPCVAEHDPAEAARLFSFEALERAYRECRKRKRRTRNALRFEQDLEANLIDLARDLKSGSYRPLRSVCFVTTRPKCREIVAADFRDRVVHHLLVKILEPAWERAFIHDSFASRKGKGTHAAVDRVESLVRKVTRNHTVRAWYAHLDIRSFFISIDHGVLLAALARRPAPPTALWLAERIIRRPIAPDAVLKGSRASFESVPPGKSLLRAPPGKGLPIGNHTSQFFANVYLDALDRYVKRVLGVRHYVRYVDDMLLLSRSREELIAWREAIDRFLREELQLELNRRRSRIAPVSSGIDFLGYVIHPRHRLVRRRVVGNLRARLSAFERSLTREAHGYRWVLYRPGESERLRAVAASYGAHLKKASTHRLRASLHGRFPWLRRALVRSDGKPFWEAPAAFPCLGAQAHWLASRFPGAVLALRVGRPWEFHGGSAQAAGRVGGVRMFRGWRAGSRGWARIPAGGLPGFLELAAAAGVGRIVVVREAGEGSGRVRARAPSAAGILAREGRAPDPAEPGSRASRG